MPRRDSYDQGSYDLARAFLEDQLYPWNEADVDNLAKQIQGVIEDQLDEWEAERRPTVESVS